MKKTNFILLLLLSFLYNSNAQKVTTCIDPTGNYWYPKIEGRYISDTREEKNAEGKIAFFSDGKAVTKYEYDFVIWGKDDPYIIVFKGDVSQHPSGYGKKGKYGLIDKMGNILLDVEYDAIFHWDGTQTYTFFKGERKKHSNFNGRWGVFDYKGTILTPCILEYSFIYPSWPYNEIKNIKIFKSVKNPTEYKGHFGYVDTNGKVLVPCVIPSDKYTVLDYVEGYVRFSIQNGPTYHDKLYGFMDSKGKITVKPEFTHSCPMKNGTFIGRHKDACSDKMFDAKGKQIDTREAMKRLEEMEKNK